MSADAPPRSSGLAPATTTPPAPPIDETVRELVAQALSRSPTELRADVSLIEDLGAESLDFLDIVFRVERAFAIEITRGEMEQAARGDMTPDAFAPGGVISDEGLERLRQLMPEAHARIRPGLKPGQILNLFTVTTFASIVRRKLAAKGGGG